MIRFVINKSVMYTAIKGIYEHGKFTLLEPAPDLEKSEVVIMFLNENKPQPKKRSAGGLLRLAHLKNKKMSIPNDFNEPLDDLKDYM
jgi:hypothetical protein